MLRKPALIFVCFAISLLSHAIDATAADIEGELSGVEYCTQELCGQAAFAGTFVGTVDGKFAFGFWSAAANHGDDPANGDLDPLPQGDGETTNMVGVWQLNVYVLRGFWFRRMSFGGTLAGELENRGDNDLPVDNFDVNALLYDPSGIFAVSGTLFHDRFPPGVVLQMTTVP